MSAQELPPLTVETVHTLLPEDLLRELQRIGAEGYANLSPDVREALKIRSDALSRVAAIILAVKARLDASNSGVGSV